MYFQPNIIAELIWLTPLCREILISDYFYCQESVLVPFSIIVNKCILSPGFLRVCSSVCSRVWGVFPGLWCNLQQSRVAQVKLGAWGPKRTVTEKHQWLLSALAGMRMCENIYLTTALSFRDFLNNRCNIAAPLHCVREEPEFQIIFCSPSILVLNLGPYFR